MLPDNSILLNEEGLKKQVEFFSWDPLINLTEIKNMDVTTASQFKFHDKKNPQKCLIFLIDVIRDLVRK